MKTVFGIGLLWALGIGTSELASNLGVTGFFPDVIGVAAEIAVLRFLRPVWSPFGSRVVR